MKKSEQELLKIIREEKEKIKEQQDLKSFVETALEQIKTTHKELEKQLTYELAQQEQLPKIEEFMEAKKEYEEALSDIQGLF